jgi:acyl-CoA reductase-like NAD-dependent aldehyde dehydrogenase
VATGRKVNVSAAADLKRVLFELDGNDAATLDRPDPADVANKITG